MTDNTPDLWRDALPRLKPDGSKYDRGHAVVLGGPIQSTGAARMAARAALRIGAGLVSVACSPASLTVYATTLQAVMTKPVKDAEAFADLIADPRINAVLIGPAAGITGHTRACVCKALEAGKACVLDADALTVFRDGPKALFEAITSPVVLTPHEGEFARIFWPVTDRESDAARAATMSGAVVLLKGRDTVIASPDGWMIVNRDAPPQLATAGSGDVLAGLITGLMAQGMDALHAAAAGAWMHAEAARRFGPGLIAEDIETQIPAVLKALNPPG
jgi:NAD(P)H-hydrate epimerase